ncbi:hypothetical protein, partial [Neisseria gonorrhoeae]|uniref:hypothetical protein n=1 Tax=Neisseria gonorrhoeae TaxID=485 RepID=UPI001BCA2518
RTMQNLTHGYSDPDDPAKRQSMTQAKDLPRNTQEAAQSITEHNRRLRSPSPIRQAKKPRRRAGNAGKGRF